MTHPIIALLPSEILANQMKQTWEKAITQTHPELYDSKY